MFQTIEKLFRSGSRSANPRRQHKNRRELLCERLEPREMLAGDVPSTLNGALALGSIGTSAIVRSESIIPAQDVDMYKFNVAAGQRVGFDIDTPTNGPPGLGSYLRLFDATGRQLDANNDRLAPGDPPPGPGSGTAGFDSYIEYTFSASGTYYVGVSNWQHVSYNPVSGATALGSDSRWLTGSYSMVLTASPNVDLAPAVVDAPSSGTIGETIAVYTDVDNLLGGASGSYTIEYRLSTDRTITSLDRLLKSVTRSSIAGNRDQRWSETVSVPSGVSPGSYWIGVIVDPSNRIAERNESNNALADTGAISLRPPLPDLDPAIVDAPATAMIGASVLVYTDVDNLGRGSSGSFTVEYRLSTDATITRSDRLLKTVGRYSISGNSDQRWTETIVIPENINLGQYWVGLIVDPNNAIAEGNESNNAQADANLIKIGAIVLGVHSNISPVAGFTDGHAWITVYNTLTNSTTYYGLWPDSHPAVPNNGSGSDVRVGMERSLGDGTYARFYRLGSTRQATLTSYVATPSHWTYWHTCASWARDAVYQVAGEFLDADDWLGFETPRELAKTIQSKESITDTSRSSPLWV